MGEAGWLFSLELTPSPQAGERRRLWARHAIGNCTIANKERAHFILSGIR